MAVVCRLTRAGNLSEAKYNLLRYDYIAWFYTPVVTVLPVQTDQFIVVQCSCVAKAMEERKTVTAELKGYIERDKPS